MMLGCKHMLCNLSPAQQRRWLLQWPRSSSSWWSAKPCCSVLGQHDARLHHDLLLLIMHQHRAVSMMPGCMLCCTSCRCAAGPIV